MSKGYVTVDENWKVQHSKLVTFSDVLFLIRSLLSIIKVIYEKSQMVLNIRVI